MIYCKFWELDSDHDLLIDMDALLRHDNYSLSSRIVRRIMMGSGLAKYSKSSGGGDGKEESPKMTYKEFICK